MARPERNTVDYFPFICEEGKKMFYIEETYGNDGFATFIKILRELAKTEHHYLNLSKGTTLMFLLAKCKIDRETLLKIIEDLVTLGKFDKGLWNRYKIIWCQDFIDSIQDAYSKRKNQCIDKRGLRVLLTHLGIRKPSKSSNKPDTNQVNSSENTESIVKYKKEKYKKIKKEKLFYFDFLFFKDLFEEIWFDEYLPIKKKKESFHIR